MAGLWRKPGPLGSCSAMMSGQETCSPPPPHSFLSLSFKSLLPSVPLSLRLGVCTFVFMQLQVCCGVHSACRRQGAAAGAHLWKGLLFALAEARPAEFLDILLHLSPSPVGTLGLQMCMAVSRLRYAQGHSQRSACGSISPSPQTPVVFWTLGACSRFLFSLLRLLILLMGT